MEIISKTADLQEIIGKLKHEHKSVGFVPTMGALHSGHISLVEKCVFENDVAVVSIFVNPTQFNDKNDLKNYPRTLEKDVLMLEEAGCSFVFVPTEAEMYPEPDTRQFDFGNLATVMEGEFRPGHFNGVAQIVSKLFDAVKPDRAYFGEKDFQQLAIIRKMTEMLHFDTKIIGCQIVREPNGLAKSSRNELLTHEERKKASLISKTLFESRTFVPELSVEELKSWVAGQIDSEPVLKTEYFEIVDGHSLQTVKNWDDSQYIMGCIAVYCGKIRLIDNVTYK